LLVRDRKIIYLEIKFSNKMRNIATWIERKTWHLILGYKNYRWNTSWVYRGVAGICVLLHMLSLELKLDDKGVGLNRSQGSMNFCKVWSSPSNHILRDCLGVWLVATCWR
jgi:hypothetical protein